MSEAERRQDAALRCVDLNKSFGGVRAVHEVSLEFRYGEVVALVGPNGAGKSTLIDVITGYVPADSGTVEVVAGDLKGRPWRRARRGKMRRTFQHPKLARGLQVTENVQLGHLGERHGTARGLAASLVKPGSLRSMREARERAEAHMDRLGLDRRRDIGGFSMGEQRLTEVARALTGSPEIVFLDEPFAGADDAGIERMGDAIRVLAEEGCAVIVVDHHVDLLADLANRLVLMFQGAVVFDGEPDAGLRSKEMRTIYFGEADD